MENTQAQTYDFYDLARDIGEQSRDVLFNMRDEKNEIHIVITNKMVQSQFMSDVLFGAVTVVGNVYTFTITDDQNPEREPPLDDTLLVRLGDLLYDYS